LTESYVSALRQPYAELTKTFAVVFFGYPEKSNFITPRKRQTPFPRDSGRIRMVTSDNGQNVGRNDRLRGKQDHKLIQILADGKLELHDLNNDPREERNLAENNQVQTQELVGWRKANDDPLPLGSALR
jgi:hypothetical protein